MDHFNNLADATLFAIPWIAFLAGLGGSLHCVGMCGGLVTACSPDKKSVWLYQIGRLLGYSFLGIFSGTIGHLIGSHISTPLLAIIPAILLGGLFVVWGIKAYKGGSFSVKAPEWFNSLYKNIWNTLLPSAPDGVKPLGVGLFSIMLPCGLLYALVLTVAAFQDPLKGAMAMGFFWLGTLPAMVLAPNLFQKIFSKVLYKSPRVIGLCFMAIGVFTIAWRVYAMTKGQGAESCH